MMGLQAFFLACYCVLQVYGALLPPENLKISSENFKHILTWEDASKESPIYYRVEYSELYHNSYKTAKDCANVTIRHCDLTKDFTDIFKLYKVRVRSFTEQDSSFSGTSVTMTPSEDTVLGPARVDVVACERCINVSVQPPVSHLWSEDEQQYVSMVIRTENTDLREKNYLVIPNLLPNTNYCVSVTIVSKSFLNNKPSIPSEVKCVVTEYRENGRSTMVYIIMSVVCGVLLLISIVLVLTGLDIAGYICRARTLIPKVLKSIPTSDSLFIDSSEFTSPTFSFPVEIISKNFEVKDNTECEVKNCEGGYANRKKLVDSDTSGTTTTSGELPSAVSSSVGSSGQTDGSAEEDISAGSLGNILPTVVSFTPVPVSATEDSSNLPFNAGGVFNVNLNTVSIADPVDVWKGFRLVEVPQEEAKDLMESEEAEISSEPHNSICIEVDDLEEEYCSEEDEEEDSSENNDSDSHLVSGYMRR
ncbi:interleukin-10 receptor subunit beta-like isoform X2 [Hyla sarda]|uniref:interleukin-10 receptor subunit beta-like isoform X2 n=1 Tax=Hyla sarda TaxID=327740 RepID=UPI0024C42AF8|nr:interleukin-10 receptor subunit beta-like isoform X2 [Hyla sarda]